MILLFCIPCCSRIEARILSGTLGARLAAEAASRKAQKHQHQQQLEEWRQQCQQQLLPGPALPEPDEKLLKVYNKLAYILQSQRWKPRPDGKRKDPGRYFLVLPGMADSHRLATHSATRPTARGLRQSLTSETCPCPRK
jgi:hypothetical protein